MQPSEQCLDLIKRFEGLMLRPYKCPGGYVTIGWGHMLTRDELHSGKIVISGQPTRYANGLTYAQADALFTQDVGAVAERVWMVLSTKAKKSILQHQFDALVSFAFNVGIGALDRSTLLKRVNALSFDAVPAQFARWVYAGGRELEGLKKRREAEVKLWLGKL